MSEWDAGTELEAEVARRVFDTPQASIDAWGVPYYSTNLVAAWNVVEHFPEMNLEHLSGGWYCWLGNDESDPSHTSTFACATAPLAICVAALAAISRGES